MGLISRQQAVRLPPGKAPTRSARRARRQQRLETLVEAACGVVVVAGTAAAMWLLLHIGASQEYLQ